MKKIKFGLLSCLCLIILSSCLTTKQTNLLREPKGDIPSYPQAKSIGEYTIKPGDELRIQITVPSDLSSTQSLFILFSSNSNYGSGADKIRTFSVSPEGTIYFPYLGTIHVQGKTTLEIREILEFRLNNGDFLKVEEGCLVNVSLDNRYFSVIGESGVGRYDIAKEQMTIFQALAQSRDINPYGDRAKIKIIRKTNLGSEIRTFDLRSEDIINSEYYYVQPNDVIYIQPLGRQFWGINSFGSIFALISTVATLGISIYSLIKNTK
ncbi:polysaccharide biosynthesis/export family protein [Bacteroidales bacterium OttesenSCG-928-M11]|nr:polysaccharide biosynthesis/export family protein [Bacteroidales bacterium OttesenSCG-928-M11]